MKVLRRAMVSARYSVPPILKSLRQARGFRVRIEEFKPTVEVPVGHQFPPSDRRRRKSGVLFAPRHLQRGATAAEMVQPVPNMALLEIYLQSALELQRRGASVITTTCGFLAALQDPIAKRLEVPFVARRFCKFQRFPESWAGESESSPPTIPV